MNAKEQYEQFDDWLTAKYREVLREWEASGAGEAEAAYDRLLKSICRDITWLQGKFALMAAIEASQKLSAMVK